MGERSGEGASGFTLCLTCLPPVRHALAWQAFFQKHPTSRIYWSFLAFFLTLSDLSDLSDLN